MTAPSVCRGGNHVTAPGATSCACGDITRVPVVRDRYWQCHGDCTVDCGACKGHGRPTETTYANGQPVVSWGGDPSVVRPAEPVAETQQDDEVERVAAALWEAQEDCWVTPWAQLSPTTPTRDKYRRYARAALAARPSADTETPPTFVDQLSRAHFGEWVDVPDRQAGGYLYVVRDEFHDGYPSRYLVLVDEAGAAAELEFTDSDPVGYPKTMSTSCTVRPAAPPHVPGQLALDAR